MSNIKHILPYSKKQPMICPYCKKKTVFESNLWRCKPCGALAKVFNRSKTPIGTMANNELWKARKDLTKAISDLVVQMIQCGKGKRNSQKAVNQSIIKELGLTLQQFNIELFDLTLCDKTMKITQKLHAESTPICPYCNQQSVFIEQKSIYRCNPCDAQVGIHKHNKAPLGTLANLELRQARMDAHAHLDPLWRYKMIKDNVKTMQARQSAYKWLAEQMGIPVEQCHIAQFNLERCEKAIEICAPYTSKAMKALNKKS